ncbi:UNVERIFIED_ORG: hypothetical protein M2328_003524 [Rhodococcus erythropolis]
MGSSSKFGRQPISQVLHDQRWQIKRFADEHGLSYQHLFNVLCGRVAASRELQKVLPDILGVPLDELFTRESLRRGSHSEIALLPTRAAVQS